MYTSNQSSEHILSVSARLNGAETVDAAATHAAELAKTAFDRPVVTVGEYDPETETFTAIGSAEQSPGQTVGHPDEIPAAVVERVSGPTAGQSVGSAPEAVVDTDPGGSAQGAVFVPLGRNRVLRLDTTESDEFDDADVALVRGIAANLETALRRLDGRESKRRRAANRTEAAATALRRLTELTTGSNGLDDSVEGLLSLCCEYLGLDTGILANVDGDDYEVEAVADATGSHEVGATYDLGNTMCDVTLAGDATDTLAFADITDTEHQDHPAAENVQAYVAASVVVDGDSYGTLNFSMERPRSEPFRPEEKAFVGLLAQRVGTEIARRHRLEELERYETILEAVDDPVYALDADGRFTFVNESAEREFGYDTEILGRSPSVGMDDSDVEQLQEQIETLLATDTRSATAEFELETADGGHKTVENRLALIGDNEFRGTAGVLRDITDRKERRRQLESFQQVIEKAADGIAILDGGEYSYVDQTHVEMYGFESKDQLLGNTWRKLYDDEEIERLETEAFPTLEADGHWRGMVTGSRPDGSTFPAELSLTIVDDGRLVCTVRDETERRERERDLELKERAMDEATVGIQITDPTQDDNPLVYVNNGFERMTGYTSEEAIGRNPRFLQGEETDPEQAARLREAIDSEEPVSLELRNRRKNGTPYWSRLSVTPVTDADGTVTNYIGIQQDVTERKKRGQEAQARVELLERIYEVTTDQQTGFEEKIDGLLKAGRDYLELPYGFLTRTDVDSDLAAGTQTILDAVGSHERLRPGASGPFSESYCQQTVDRDGEFALTNAAESEFIKEAAYDTFGLETYIGSTVSVDSDVYGTLCFASGEQRESPFDEFERTFVSLLGRWAGYEIDRRNTHEELRQQQEKLGLTLSGTNTGIAEWNLRTDTMRWDETLVDLAGQDIESVEEFREAVHPDDRDRVRRELNSMIESGDPWTGEFRIVGDGDDTTWLSTRATPVYDDGNPVRVLATGTNITEQKIEERTRRQNEQRYRSLAENIPNGAVLTFDDNLEYVLAAGELLSVFGLETSDISGKAVGTVLADGNHDLVPRFRATLDGERTDRRVEIRDRTLRVHLVPVDRDNPDSTSNQGLVLAQDVTDEVNREQELLEERERFRLLTESVDEYAFLTVDEGGTVQTWNPGAASLFGYDADTAIGMSISELHPESDRESGLPGRLLQQARIGGESAHEGYQVRADGSEFYADVRYAPLESDDRFQGYAGVVHDMTDRRRRQRRTELFVEESTDVVTIVDPDGTIRYASGSTKRTLGYDPEELVEENLFDFLHPDSREHALQTFYTCVDGADSAKAECRFSAPDDGWLNIETRCRNMLDDEAIDGILIYLRNVTESKQRARRFEGIFNQTFQFTGLLEPDGTVVEVNDAALEFGGVGREEIVGNRFFDARWWTHSETVRNNIREAIERAAGGEFVRYETEVRGGDGLATIDFSVKPVWDENDNVSLLVVEGRDITAQQQVRRHLEVIQRVIRHNMRNDLTKVRAWTRLMSEESDAKQRAEQFEIVERVLEKWESMTERINDIRQILQSQNGDQTTMDSRSLIENAVTPVREGCEDTTVLTELPSGEGVQLPASLLEAVRELVGNAADASEDATIAVELTYSEDGWVEVDVRDDGPGMPAMEADLLETGEETPLNHGQGLGLWMVRMVVTQAGGDVWVDSTTERTEICLRVPRARWDRRS